MGKNLSLSNTKPNLPFVVPLAGRSSDDSFDWLCNGELLGWLSNEDCSNNGETSISLKNKRIIYKQNT